MPRVTFGRAARPVDGPPPTGGESAAEDTDGRERPGDAAGAAVTTESGTDAALDEVLRLAREPLDPFSADPEPSAYVRDQGRGAGVEDDPALRAALTTLADSHRRTTDAVTSLVASAGPRRDLAANERVTLEALDAVRAIAERPAAPVHVHVPEQNVQMAAPVVTVNVPEQQPPTVDLHVAAPEVNVQPPNVEVHVAAAEPAPAPEPPVVNVTVPAPQVAVNVAPAPPAPPRAVRFEHDEQGRRIIRTVDEDATPDREV